MARFPYHTWVFRNRLDSWIGTFLDLFLLVRVLALFVHLENAFAATKVPPMTLASISTIEYHRDKYHFWPAFWTICYANHLHHVSIMAKFVNLFFHENLSWFWSQYALLFVSITVLQDILGSSPMHVSVPWTTLIHHLFQQILATCRVNTAFSQPCKAIPKTLPVEEHMIIARLIRPGRTLSYAGVALSETNPVLWEDATVVFLGFLCSISTLYLFEKKGIDHGPCRKPWGDANICLLHICPNTTFFSICFMDASWISCFNSPVT